jgi:molecular chaperone DnaJ
MNLDAEVPVRISFIEAVLGCDRDIRLQKEDGTGTQTLRVHIPAGIDSGKSVRLRGRGHSTADGSRKGDLLLKVTVEESKAFSRKGNDLYTTASVPFTTAVLGGEAEVRMPGGRKILCKVPKGTDAGKKIRIRGKGIHPEKSSAQPGDLYVTVQVQVPKDLTDAEIRKLREFETLYNQRRSGRAHSA